MRQIRHSSVFVLSVLVRLWYAARLLGRPVARRAEVGLLNGFVSLGCVPSVTAFCPALSVPQTLCPANFVPQTLLQ
jgi:hypothetical protein